MSQPVSAHSGTIRPGVHCLLADNAGIMTLDGTNTWLLHAPDDDQAVVVDIGPDDEGHLDAVRAAAAERGLTIAAALLTHGHPDHSEGSANFARAARCPVHAADRRYVIDTEPLSDDNDVIRAGALEIQAIATPGHSSDSVSFLVPGLGVLLTGDTVLGRGTTVVAYPDGQLGPYLESLATLRVCVGAAGPELILPGHGPVVDQPAGVIDFYLAHRQARLDQVRNAVAGGAQTARQVVELVYADVDQSLWPAAELSVEAQLAYLRSQQD